MCITSAVVGIRLHMSNRRIVHVRAKDFHTALYVGFDDDARFLVGTDHLCPDCATPIIVLEGGDEVGSLRMFHDPDCVVAQRGGGTALSESERERVTEIRRRHLDDSLEVW